ncbi:MAG: DinB family protein [Leptolinea sp.]|jgi:hypothetical protein|nr:DinB family protein [Leptolinea sp.]
MVDKVISRGELLEQYATGPQRLETVLRNLSDDDLEKCSAPGEWSIREIAHHIADGDDLWKICILAALGNPDGEFTLQWYWDRPQMEWSRNWKYTERSVEISLALLRANRAHMVELLRLTPDAWERSVKIRWPGESEESRISVEDVVRMHVEHLTGHLDDIHSILNQ